MRERKETVTLKATSWELERWRNAAHRVKRDLPRFLIFAATPQPATSGSWTASAGLTS
jgi:hypothetical protein